MRKTTLLATGLALALLAPVAGRADPWDHGRGPGWGEQRGGHWDRDRDDRGWRGRGWEHGRGPGWRGDRGWDGRHAWAPPPPPPRYGYGYGYGYRPPVAYVPPAAGAWVTVPGW